MGLNPLSIPRDIRALLFDLGNVLIDVDFRRCARFLSEQAGVPTATLISRFHIDHAYQEFERGRMGASDYYTTLRRMLGIDLPEDVMREGWNMIIREEKPGIRQCLATLTRRYPLYVLTNTNPEHETVWRDLHRDLLASFKEIYVSSRMGCRKPDAEVYHATARAIGHPCEHILFFDDAEENIVGARRCGMHAVQVIDHHTIPSVLPSLAVDPDA